MGVEQRSGAVSSSHISRVVSKSDRDHGTATTDNKTLGLTTAGTISRSNLSLGLYPLLRHDGCKDTFRILLWVISFVRALSLVARKCLSPHTTMAEIRLSAERRVAGVDRGKGVSPPPYGGP